MASNVDAKLLKQTKFPLEFNQKVDMEKVNVEVMKKWIAGKISEILGSEDDVVTELCFNLLEGARFPDIKVLQIQLTGFLDKDTPKFCKELWTLCLSAQNNAQGVPKELLEAKKLELIQEKIDAEKAAEQARKRKEQEKIRDRNLENVRQRERNDRGGDRGRSNRGHHEHERRPQRVSRSPPNRRRSPTRRSEHRAPPPRRETDTYIPSSRGRRRSDDRYRSSPSIRRSVSYSISRSRSPTRRPRRRDDNVGRSRRHRYTPSRSPPPLHRGSGSDRWRRNPGRGDDRARSFTPSETSRSRSPRRTHRTRSPIIPPSPTPPPRSRAYRQTRRSPSISKSRSRSVGRDNRRSDRFRRSYSQYTDYEAGEARADYRKERRHRDERRRSPRRSPRHSASRSRSRDRRTRPPAAVASRSPSPSRRRERKRHRSIERYAPAPRRRRNTSSVSSPIDKRRKTADSSGDEGHRHPPSKSRVIKPEKDALDSSALSEETRPSTLTATELREKILREKVLASRKSNSAQRDPASREAPKVATA